MRENILILLLDLFALIGKSDSPHLAARRKIEVDYLYENIEDIKGAEILKRYDDIVEQALPQAERDVRMLEICKELDHALTQRQKANGVIRLIEYVLVAEPYDYEEYASLKAIGTALNISDEEFDLMQSLVECSYNFQGPNALIISSESNPPEHLFKHILRPKLQGIIRIAYIPSADLYFARYDGPKALQLNGALMKSGSLHVFTSGAVIRGEIVRKIYYSDVITAFRKRQSQKIVFKADKISYRFPDGTVGLHELSFSEQSGQMIGIMGSSGAGKSTLLNVLNGSARPTTGSITLNGTNLYDQRQELKGVVGFVSQDDLLMEDLTVFQNMYFNAQLSFAGKTDEFIRKKVNRLAKHLDLLDVLHLKVGNPLEKIISGGQRKRLNIALELIREPAVLFFDEPTSGLSSKDSEKIIDLIKQLALRGTLVFVVIHQPSSQIFKAFDKLLLLDKGGFPVYWGNPIDAITYFKHATNQINPDLGECLWCGNVNSEQIFSIMEVRQLDENGFPKGERRISPKEWNAYFKEQQALAGETLEEPSDKFENDYRKPGLLKQFSVFIQRDVLSKLNNRQYMFITLLEAPVLASLLAFLMRYQAPGQEYSFQDNRNIVAYIFMSVIVALFLGLMVSAEEILQDRKIRKRERFLNLSRASYLGSKITILFVISALQALLFVLVGNSIMGFSEHYFEFWLMFLVLSLYANALGLNASSALKSAVAIYILIPFLIIPQLMLSGLLVKFEELNPTLSKRSIVPWSGDMMATRWAFEGLAVQVFTENSYEKPIYDLEKQKVNLTYFKANWFYKMSELLPLVNPETSDSLLPVLAVEFEKVGADKKYATLESIQSGETKKKLFSIRSKFSEEYAKVQELLDGEMKSMDNETGLRINWVERRKLYFNDRLEELVRNRDVLTDKIFLEDGALHPGDNGVFFDPPKGQTLRAHLFAPKKYLLGGYFKTYWINILVILLMAVVLHVLLYYRVFEMAVNRMSNFKMFSRQGGK